VSLFRSHRIRHLGAIGIAAFAAQTLTACYSQQPVVDPAAVSGRNVEVMVDLTDRGRYELRGALGESPRTVQGRLVAVDDSTLTLAATNVLSLTGENVTWTGERVALPRTGIALVQQRSLSRGRSVLAAVVAVGPGARRPRRGRPQRLRDGREQRPLGAASRRRRILMGAPRAPSTTSLSHLDMKPLARLSLALLGTAGLVGCKDDAPTFVNPGPQAYVRYVNASPDSPIVDARFVDLPENTRTFFGLAFRQNSGFYQAVNAGNRKLRVFLAGTAIDSTSTVVAEGDLNLAERTYYTIVQVGTVGSGLGRTNGNASFVLFTDTIPAVADLAATDFRCARTI
jgi:hypothetical protein